MVSGSRSSRGSRVDRGSDAQGAGSEPPVRGSFRKERAGRLVSLTRPCSKNPSAISLPARQEPATHDGRRQPHGIRELVPAQSKCPPCAHAGLEPILSAAAARPCVSLTRRPSVFATSACVCQLHPFSAVTVSGLPGAPLFLPFFPPSHLPTSISFF